MYVSILVFYTVKIAIISLFALILVMSRPVVPSVHRTVVTSSTGIKSAQTAVVNTSQTAATAARATRSKIEKPKEKSPLYLVCVYWLVIIIRITNFDCQNFVEYSMLNSDDIFTAPV